MTSILRIPLALLLIGLSPPLLAQDASMTFGGDQYTAGQTATISAPVARNAFLAGYNIKLEAPVVGDAHLAGYSVAASAAISGDLYAAGYGVTISAPVGGDLTAAGNNVSVLVTAPVTGNLRLVGANVSVGAPIEGSALITAQTLTLDAVVTGDLNFIGENLVFGPSAVVTGTVLIQAPKEIAIPSSVASADRITYQPLTSPDYMGEAGKTAENVVRGFWPQFGAAAIWWLALVLVGAAFIAFMPRAVAALELASQKRPLRLLGAGFLAFAATLGLLPVFAITVVGILLLPFVLLFVAIACSLAFVTGAFSIGMSLARRFLPVTSNLGRVAVLAATLVVTALLGMIPILGWVVTLTVLIFGYGVLALAIFTARVDRANPKLPGATLPNSPIPQPAV